MNEELYGKIKASLEGIKKGIDDFNHRSNMRAFYPPEVEFEFKLKNDEKVTFKVESGQYPEACWPKHELGEIKKELSDHAKYCHPDCPKQKEK